MSETDESWVRAYEEETIVHLLTRGLPVFEDALRRNEGRWKT